ncbi:MAG: AAA-like domain-containing protein [Anaerolineae bacterium]|nr:AAA-like domain-containing protein [Anaerolineae bacterium]
MTLIQRREAEFFRAGGTLHPDSPSYIRRTADINLMQQIAAIQFCYVLTPRQMGKSSLMIRTAGELRSQGIKVAIIDLSVLGTQATVEQWYLGILKRLAQDLRLSVDPESWWHARRTLGPVQRFTDFIHDIILGEIEEQIVVFVDEIDSTLKLDFTDDFFAAIRVMYNLRASEPEYERLTFVLLGVASPGDLIKDRNRTPFNIGQAIDLKEFSRQDAQALENGLNEIYPGQGQRILDRIFYWTNGHPYLTQKLCYEIATATDADATTHWTQTRIDATVYDLFFSPDAQAEDNLQFVRSHIQTDPQRRDLLHLYRRVYKGQPVQEDKRSLVQNRLSLIGLVYAQDGRLQVRNEIYRHVFDLAWIRENTPINWSQITILGSLIVSLIALLVAFVVIPGQERIKQATQINTYVEGFRTSSSANAQIFHLSKLCGIEQCETARQIFFERPSKEQLAMFEQVDAGAGDRLAVVAGCLYPSVAENTGTDDQAQALSQAICCAMHKLGGDHWARFQANTSQTCECTTKGNP